MELWEAIKKRRSIRSFQDRDVEEEKILKMIEAATWAPSAGNVQPWEFVVVRNPEIRKKLAEAAYNQRFIEKAPVDIVVVADERRSAYAYGDRGRTLYCIQDTAAAIQNMLLVATEMGLGTCWVGAFNEQAVKELLGIPFGCRPVAIIAVGYPAETPSAPVRKNYKDLIHYDRF